jgi:hypothetical protein
MPEKKGLNRLSLLFFHRSGKTEMAQPLPQTLLNRVFIDAVFDPPPAWQA